MAWHGRTWQGRAWAILHTACARCIHGAPKAPSWAILCLAVLPYLAAAAADLEGEEINTKSGMGGIVEGSQHTEPLSALLCCGPYKK